MSPLAVSRLMRHLLHTCPKLYLHIGTMETEQMTNQCAVGVKMVNLRILLSRGVLEREPTRRIDSDYDVILTT